MEFNKKIFCALIVLIVFLSVSSVSAADNVSDIIAADNSVADSGISISYDEKLESASTHVVTNETYGDYFTAEGVLSDNVSAGSTLDFQGTFAGEKYKMNISKPVNIISSTGDGLFDEIGKNESSGGFFFISAGASGTNVSGITFLNSAILIDAPNILISNIVSEYILQNPDEAYAICASGADNLTIEDNVIHFNVITDGADINNAVYVYDSSNVLLQNNSIVAVVPSCYVDWKYNPSTGTWVKAPLSEGLVFDECEDLDIIGNEIVVSYNDVVGAFDTLYAIDITNSRNVEISDNHIELDAHTYGYALYVESDGLLVDNNNFTSYSDEYYANGIEIEASKDAVISNNNFEVEAPNFAYPIYSGMNGGDLEAKYVNNSIYATADIVYGMELSGTAEEVLDNTIRVNGNRTTGLAVKSKEASIVGNTIYALGDNLGNSTSPDSFVAMTTGINLQNAVAVVKKNLISSKSRGIFVDDGGALINNNNIMVYDNRFDDSYAIIANDAEIEVRLNNITYVGNTEGSTVNNAINLNDCVDSAVEDNNIIISIPSCYVDWKEEPAGSGIWVKYPVSEGLVFNGCDGLILNENNISVEYSSVVGFYDTIYAIDIKDSPNATMIGNTIVAAGHSYIYGLYIEADDAVVDSNEFTIESDVNYANGIEVEASKGIVFSNNEIEVTAPDFAYPIYSGMNGGDLEAKYVNNSIYATADIVYGMELCGAVEEVYENTITVDGNKTTGLAVKSKEASIEGNVIYTFGDNLGNSSSVDSFVAMTTGINLQNSAAVVQENLINSKSRGIFVDGGDALIRNNEIHVEDNGLDDSYAIIANDALLAVRLNDIKYVGYTQGSTVNNAINLNDCNDSAVENNNIKISIPSCYVDWKEEPAGSGIWVKYPVSEGLVFNGCDGLILNENIIDVEYNSIVGAYDTIYAIDIKDSPNATMIGNTINATGHSYIYGLYIEADDAVVDSNEFTIESDVNYANGIEVEASKGIVFSNNEIEVTAPDFAYPIYSGMNGGDLEAKYVNNSIYATADIVYGMELCGAVEEVLNNTITVDGDKTTGLAVKSKEAVIDGNAIYALGDNLGNSSSVDSFAAMTTGINLQNSAAVVQRNEIISKSRGIFVNGGDALIRSNVIHVDDNSFDDSYAIFADDALLAVYLNDIAYHGNTNGSTVNNAICIKDCPGVALNDNNINITIPSCYVDWKEEPAGSGNWVANPISEGILIESSGAIVQENNITVNYNTVVGMYDTIYAVHLVSDGTLVVSNNIDANGHSYIYGLEISGSDFIVVNNTISSASDACYANGIDVEGPAMGIVQNNIISVEAPEVTYAVYSAMSNGNVSVDYIDNVISSSSIAAYGMELTGLKEKVKGNSFDVGGYEAIGIYSASKDVSVVENTFDLASDEKSTAFLGKSGNATITDNIVNADGEYTVDVSKITALVKDNYLIAANLTGDASVNYDPETSSVYNNTPKMDKYFIMSEGLEKYFGNKKQLEFTLLDALGNPASNKTISIVINGKTYNRTTDENGTARIGINLNSGNYTVTATYENISEDADVTILPTIEGKDITKVFKNATQYEATFVDVDGNPLKNTNVTFNINGVMYKRSTDDNGTARLNINLPQGEYIITAINPVNGENLANNITVLPSITDNADLTKYYKNDSQYVVKIIGADGNPVKAGEVVTFNINGVFYNRTTNESGYAKLNINLRPGDYVITATYNGCSVANNITVLTVLETDDMTMKYKDNSTFKAKVLDGQGNPLANQTVQFNINGRLYNRTSGSDGIAQLKINLIAGEYIITSMYNGYGVANKITISS